MRSHRSVMVNEVLRYLITNEDGIYVDGTLGDGGHSLEILKNFDNVKIIGIDEDYDALNTASKKLSLFGNRITLFCGNFANLESLVREEVGIMYVNGVLLDIGLRQEVVDDPERGFSFLRDGPLDMRFDKRSQRTAYIVVNRYSQKRLAEIFKNYGDVKKSRHIAEAIVSARKRSPIATTGELAQIIKSLFPPSAVKKNLQKVFQAIRIEVNDELNALKSALEQSLEILEPGGRIVVISYHSGEDRIVKNFFATEAKDCICPPEIPVCRCGHRRTLKVITRKVVRPTDDEIAKNPSAKSARMRVAEKI